MSKKIYVSSPFEMYTVPECVRPGCFECVEAVSRRLLAALQVLLEKTSEFPFQKAGVKKKEVITSTSSVSVITVTYKTILLIITIFPRNRLVFCIRFF